MIERQVAEGRAVDRLAFVEEAVRRLVDDTMGEEDELLRAVEAGSTDIAAGRCVAVTTGEDEERVRADMMARLRRAVRAASDRPTD